MKILDECHGHSKGSMQYSGRMSFEQFLKNLFDLSETSIFCPSVLSTLAWGVNTTLNMYQH